MKFYGGKAIASGSYGCVFYPSIKCKNKNSKSVGVSKLMLKKDAEKEYNDILEIRKKVSAIPNYNNYFILAFEKCGPEKLSSQDMENMNEKCKRFLHAKTKIQDYEIINIPYGGNDIDVYLRGGISIQKFLTLNRSLKTTLVNGVIPMNNLDIYHLDLKIDNFLINDKNQIKIIDWGFTIFHNNKIPNVDSDVEYRSFNFNSPFSILLFSPLYINLINTYINQLSSKNKDITISVLATFIKDIFKKYDDENKHYKITNYVIKSIIDELNLEFTSEDIIFNYLASCVYKYMKNDNKGLYFDEVSLFNEVFLKNCDIFGSLTIYFSLMEYVQYHSQIFDFKNEDTKKMFKKDLCKILYNHLLKDGTSIINIQSFFNDMNKLKLHFKPKKSVTKSVTKRNIKHFKKNTRKIIN
jgi:hypothetical protein